LIQVNKGTHVISYRYDGLGRRIAKIVDGVETRYVLDGANVVEERNVAGALTAVNLHAGVDRLLMRQDYAVGATYWVHTDHQGSVEALTDVSGNVVERYRYTSFGQITVMDAAFGVLSAAPKIPFTYTAREWEPEVEMYFYRARFMDPKMGRFISQDPLGFGAGDLNVLAYVSNNAINGIDPMGLQEKGAPNSVTLSASNGTPGTDKPVFNAGDVAAVLGRTPVGQSLLERLKSGEFVIKTADVYSGRDSKGDLIPDNNLIAGYAQGTKAPGLIVINNLASSRGPYEGTDGQFYAYTLGQEVNEYDLFWAKTPGNDKAVEVINRVNAESQAKAMDVPGPTGYRTASGAPDVGRITRDVANNPGYSGSTHGGRYIIKNGVVVAFP
jgi:RHS repeat-associated protein